MKTTQRKPHIDREFAAPTTQSQHNPSALTPQQMGDGYGYVVNWHGPVVVIRSPFGWEFRKLPIVCTICHCEAHFDHNEKDDYPKIREWVTEHQHAPITETTADGLEFILTYKEKSDINWPGKAYENEHEHVVNWYGHIIVITNTEPGPPGPLPYVCTFCHCEAHFEADGPILSDKDDRDNIPVWMKEHQHFPPTKSASKTSPASDAATDSGRDDVITP